MSINKMILLVKAWGEERGLYENTTAKAQLLGALGEIHEFREAIIKDRPQISKESEAGDVIVFLINWAIMSNSMSTFNVIDDLLLDGIEIPLQNDPIEDEFLDGIAVLSSGDINGFIKHYLPFLISYIDSTPAKCLDVAYAKISGRDGEMKNGKFVKSIDL